MIRKLGARVDSEGHGPDPAGSVSQLLEKMRPRVARFFLRRGFSPDECMDLTQEVSLAVVKGLPAFRGVDFEAWVFGIAGNLYKYELRYRTAEKRGASIVSLDEIPAEEWGQIEGSLPGDREDPLQSSLARERMELLREAMKTLPPQMRRCVLMRVNSDMKYREIAEFLQVSVDTVKAHLFQARQQLKGRLKDYFSDVDYL